MAEKKRKFNACKERGSLGKREEIVLNENHLLFVDNLNPSKLINPLIAVGILDPDEVREVLKAGEKMAVTLIMTYVKDSGRDAFVKFMEALRMADYNELAADVEVQLENTVSPTTEPNNTFTDGGTTVTPCSDVVSNNAICNSTGNDLKRQLLMMGAQSLINVGLQRCGLGPRQPVLGISVEYRRHQEGQHAISDWHVNSALNITPDLVLGLYNAWN